MAGRLKRICNTRCLIRIDIHYIFIAQPDFQLVQKTFVLLYQSVDLCSNEYIHPHDIWKKGSGNLTEVGFPEKKQVP